MCELFFLTNLPRKPLWWCFPVNRLTVKRLSLQTLRGFIKDKCTQVHQDESESVTRDNHHSPPLSDELKHTRTGWQSHPASVPRQLDKNHMKTLRSSGHDISDYSLTSEISTVSRASKKCHSDKSIIIKINLIVNQFNLEKRKLSAKTNYSKQFVSFQITSVQVTARKLVKHTF